MKITESGSSILTAALAVWLVVLAVVPLLCATWLSQAEMVGLMVLEAFLSLALLSVRVRARRTQQEKRQVSAMRSAIERGVIS